MYCSSFSRASLRSRIIWNRDNEISFVPTRIHSSESVAFPQVERERQQQGQPQEQLREEAITEELDLEVQELEGGGEREGEGGR